MRKKNDRGGRPPLPAGERMIPIPLRLPVDMVREADAHAIAYGMSRSEFLRWAISESMRAIEAGEEP
jgi:acetyl-CoA acetyltransferase